MALKISSTNVVNNDRSFSLGSATPGSPVTGQIRFNSRFEVYNGTSWVAIANQTSTGSMWTWGRSIQGAGGTYTYQASSPIEVAGNFSDWSFLAPTQFWNGGGIRPGAGIWMWGPGNYGTLGNGNASYPAGRSSPVSVVGSITDWQSLAIGRDHVVALRADGRIYSWGRNNRGQLGVGDVTNRSSPVTLAGALTNWRAVGAGVFHSLAILNDGTAWAWGYNPRGQLGLNAPGSSRTSPVAVVGGFTDWKQVTGGWQFSVGLRADGTLWTWGANNYGQLGTNNTTSRSSPVSVIGGFTDWVQIAGGYGNIGAVRANGTLWGIGNNQGGILGLNTTANASSPQSVVGGFTDWVQVAMGNVGFTNFGLRANGTLWSWGYDNNGARGQGTDTFSSSSPASVIGGFTDWVQVGGFNQGGRALRAL